MKSLIFIPIIIYSIAGVFLSDDAFARSLKATADKLSSQTTAVGFSLALLGFGISAIYMIFGKQDASLKFTQCCLGTLCLWVAPSIINFIKMAA